MAPTSPYALILDDHPLVAHGMAEFLRARLPQMEVVEAAGADDLLRWVEMRGTPAIALIDFWLAEGAACLWMKPCAPACRACWAASRRAAAICR